MRNERIMLVRWLFLLVGLLPSGPALATAIASESYVLGDSLGEGVAEAGCAIGSVCA